MLKQHPFSQINNLLTMLHRETWRGLPSYHGIMTWVCGNTQAGEGGGHMYMPMSWYPVRPLGWYTLSSFFYLHFRGHCTCEIVFIPLFGVRMICWRSGYWQSGIVTSLRLRTWVRVCNSQPANYFFTVYDDQVALESGRKANISWYEI